MVEYRQEAITVSGRAFVFVFAAFGALLQGCGRGPAVPVLNGAASSQQTSSDNQAGPPRCKGQVVTDHRAEVTERIPRKGASLCVPSFGGFGGFLGFPSVHPAPQPVRLIVTVPKKKSAPIFDLEWLPSEQFTFGKTAPPGGISGSALIPGQTYTGYGVMYFKGSHKDVGPCYSVAKRGQYGGVFNDLGTLMENQGGSFLQWDLSIVHGKETGRKC
jgi:hypothetical protein